ncbi:MAG: hypothetical protein GXP48_12455 [Acidobacteria bacterium]|nr:hypothetical protein [Acidobacteriota bacterium]
MAVAPKRLERFLAAYQEYVQHVLRPTQTEVMRLLRQRQDPAYWSRHRSGQRVALPSPIRTSFSRIKRPEQVVDKILRKPQRFPAGLQPVSFRSMSDALGVRVIVFVLSHLALVDREIRSSNEIEISKKEPPMIYASADQARMLGLEHLVQKEKESGYSSVHYTIRLRHTSVPRKERPWFELQVRTLAQELWSEIEHHLGYKPGRRSNVSARRQLRILAKHIAAIDEHFNFLYEELNRFQQTVSYSRDDPLSVENLPSVLAEIGLTCAQRDMNNILKLLYSRGLETVGALGTLATPRRLEIIRHTYLSVTGRLPTSLEVIATLAALVGAETEEEEIERIKSQIAYRWAWDAIRSEHTTSAK